MMFPTTSVAAPVVDAQNGASKIPVNGGPLVDTFATMIRNSDPGSTTGLPGITLPAGLTATGLPVGLSLDGTMESDTKLLGIGLSMEALLGVLPQPKLPSTSAWAGPASVSPSFHLTLENNMSTSVRTTYKVAAVQAAPAFLVHALDPEYSEVERTGAAPGARG